MFYGLDRSPRARVPHVSQSPIRPDVGPFPVEFSVFSSWQIPFGALSAIVTPIQSGIQKGIVTPILPIQTSGSAFIEGIDELAPAWRSPFYDAMKALQRGFA